MCCPWCSGYVSADRDEHDQFCPWPKVKRDIEVQRKIEDIPER